MSRPAPPHSGLNSEEDVRGKVVLTWLAGLGFVPADILIEHSFDVPLGRSRLSVGSGTPATPRSSHPRADLLVRHVDGRNLLIVEVKAPGRPLDDAARDQGISYARLLQDGGIAPFVILTNGHETRIFDSISREEIQGECIPQDHRHVRAGFKVTGDVFELRSEALERLLSLNPSNLLRFCEAQVAFRMRRLRGSDLSSGRKYIPNLYIPRPEPQKRLDELISEGRRIILLIGPPQIGKTNLMCHTAEARLSRKQPALFYPASAIDGLLGELRDDFEWTFGQNANSQALIAERLLNIVRTCGERLVIFIDGWNEATIEVAHSLENHISRISSNQVQFVISLTSASAHRLLFDKAGNPSLIADEAGLSNRSLAELEWRWRPAPDELGVVRIREYNFEEAKAAYSRYSSLLKVKVPPSHHMVHEPLLLQTAMLTYEGGTLPDVLVAPELLERLINTKLSRARLYDSNIGRPLLIVAAEELFKNGSPIREDKLLSRWNVPLSEGVPGGLFDAALLARRGNESATEGIDFYSDRERDFVIAYWVCHWERLYKLPSSALSKELELAARTEPGKAALSWFLGQPANHATLKRCFDELDNRAGDTVQEALLRALHEHLRAASREFHSQLTQEAEARVFQGKFKALEAVAAVASYVDEARAFWIGLDDPYGFTRGLLLIDAQFPLQNGKTGEPVLELLHGVHSEDEGWVSFEIPSDVTKILTRLAEDPNCRSGAIKALGHVAPHIFFEWLNHHLPNEGSPSETDAEIYLGAIDNAGKQMYEPLYSAFGREGGIVDFARERDPDNAEEQIERHREEYLQFKDLYEGAIRHFSWHPAGQRLQGFLDSLLPDEDRVSTE